MAVQPTYAVTLPMPATQCPQLATMRLELVATVYITSINLPLRAGMISIRSLLQPIQQLWFGISIAIILTGDIKWWITMGKPFSTGLQAATCI